MSEHPDKAKASHKRLTEFPTKLPAGIAPDAREAFLILNDWAKEMQRWSKTVSRAVGHEQAARLTGQKEGAAGSPTHIVGDPPHPPFDE